jgi:hypothetical protein
MHTSSNAWFLQKIPKAGNLPSLRILPKAASCCPQVPDSVAMLAFSQVSLVYYPARLALEALASCIKKAKSLEMPRG